MIDRLLFDPRSGTTRNNRIYIKDGLRYNAPFSMYMYNYHDLPSAAVEKGLVVRKVFGGWKGETFDSDFRRIILILEKEQA